MLSTREWKMKSSPRECGRLTQFLLKIDRDVYVGSEDAICLKAPGSSMRP